MISNLKKIVCVAVLSALSATTICIRITQADESVLVKKPAEASAAPLTGPVLPPPQNPNEQSTNNGRSDVLAPPADAATLPEPLPTPPQSRQSSAPTAKQSFMRPAEPREPAKGKLVGVEPIPLPPQPTSPSASALPMPEDVMPPSSPSPLPSGITVKPTPPIDYDTHHDARKMLRGGQINIAMLTQDPADGCYYQIPLTVPACCVGEPRVSGTRGLLGRGIVAYEWPCGFKAKIKFRHVLGDVKVDYEAD